MAETTAPKKAVNVGGNVDVIEDMLSNLKLDIEARDEHIKIREESAEFVNEANDRIKKGSQALSFMTEYMTQEQIDEVEELDLFYIDEKETEERSRLNEVAQSAFDIISNSKTGQMTNGELYEKYAKTATDEEPAVKYGEFNIKLRSLFSNMRLLREVPEHAENSHSHIIKVNGFKAGKS